MFGERLQELRRNKGLTQKDISDLIKVAPSTVGMYEQGRRDPDTETLRTLASFFSVSIDYLLGRTDIKDPVNSISRTVALHRDDGYEDDLPEEAKKEIDTFIEFVKQKYKKKD